MTTKFSQFTNGSEVQVDDEVVGLRDGNNARFDFPGAGIKDSAGNYLFQYATTSGVGTNAVNYVLITNALTGNAPSIGVGGQNTNISLTITSKGTGNIDLDPAGTGSVRMIGTGAFRVPVGTTGERPTVYQGAMRLNTTSGFFEVSVDGSNWVDLAVGGGGVASVTGTANRITVGGTAADPVIDIASTYVGQNTITTVGTITTGTWTGTTIATTSGGTGLTSYTLGDILYSSAANTLAKLAGNTTVNKMFLSQTGNGAVSAAPVWEAIDGGDITGAALTRVDDANVTLTLGGTPATALLQATSLTLGWSGQLSLTRGGTNASLTADNGAIVYSTGTALALLASTATARQMLQSGASAAPAWSTATWPATTTVNQLLYSSSANTVTGLATANDGVLVTDGSGVPSISSTLPSGVITNIAGRLKSVQVFTANGTWTKAAGITTVIVEVLGGGGGGGFVKWSGSGEGSGGGGGAGGYAKELIDVAGTSSEAVTIGAAGAGGIGASSTAATAGGTSSFGAYISCTGGSGGTGMNTGTGNNYAPGGAGGSGAGGTVNGGGMPGFPGRLAGGVLVLAGFGGSTIYGGGGQPPLVGNGNAGTGYGAGGSAGSTNAADQNGGAGTAGIVIVWEFS